MHTGYYDRLIVIIALMRENQIPLTREDYSALAYCTASAGKLDVLDGIIECMRIDEVHCDTIFFNGILSGVLKSKYTVKEIELCIDLLRQHRVSFNATTYRSVILAYSHLGSILPFKNVLLTFL